jgi:hypothetical protein
MSKILKILMFDRDKSFFRYFKRTFPDFDFVFYLDSEKDFFYPDFNLILFIQEGAVEKHIMFLKLLEKEIPIVFGTYETMPFYKKHRKDQFSTAKVINMLESKENISSQLKIIIDNIDQ